MPPPCRVVAEGAISYGKIRTVRDATTPGARIARVAAKGAVDHVEARSLSPPLKHASGRVSASCR